MHLRLALQAASGLAGYEKAKHLYFNDYSLTLTATLRGQGVALSAPIYVRSQLRSGRLQRIGRTPVTFGDYWLLQATDRGSARARAAFVDWFAGEIQRVARRSFPHANAGRHKRLP